MTADVPSRDMEVLPLSPAQSGMLLDAVRGDAPDGSYVGLVSVALDGPLDPDRLRSAIRAAVGCRDALRASFVWQGLSAPLQIIHRDVGVTCGFEDWSELSAEAFRQALDARMGAERTAGFDIEKSPLLRAVVIREGAARHVLLFTIHHLVCDGWSMAVLIDDLLRRYHASGPVPEGLEPGSASYRDYLVWRKTRDGSAGAPFWRDYFSASDIPGAIATEAGADGSGLHRIESADIDPALEQSARNLARTLRVTFPTLLSAVWALLLRRFGAGGTVVFGVTNAGRPAEVPGLDRAVGAFVNTLPMRAEMDPQQTVRDFLVQSGANADARRPREFDSLGDVRRWAGIGGGAPPYQTVFAYEGFPGLSEATGNLKVAALKTIAPSSDALALSVVPGQKSRIDLYHDPAKHGRAVVARMAEDYLGLLAAIIADPDRRTGDLAMTIGSTAAEPASPASWPRAAVHDQFWLWVEKTPDAPAVRCGEGRLTYAELARMAEALASGLAEQAVGPGDIVPIALTRSVASVAAMLAVLRCGAAYAPVDLDYPPERLRMMFDACRPKAIITSRGDAERLPETDANLVFADDPPPVAPHPAKAVSPDDTAYVIFTSGSQGRPKGVVVTHANLAYSTGVRNEVYGGPPPVFLVLSSLAFDSSVVGLYWALTSGGEVVLSTPRIEQDMAALGDLIQSASISHLLCLPALYQTILDLIPQSRLATLDTVIAAGEPVPASLVRAHHRRPLARCRLFNEYGPTEATVWATVYDTADHAGGDVPIGKALPGGRVMIADPDGHPLPDGATGEIVIGGPGVAAGYLNDPAATALAFLPDPNIRGSRLYRTGDLGRRRQDGQILYFGRCDDQIKIRGHRIELAEIEDALRRLLNITECAVAAPAGPNGQRLVAFVTGLSQSLDQSGTRRALSDMLPAFMLPSSIVALDRLPYLPNGKIDRAALVRHQPLAPAEECGRAQQPLSFVEARLAEIWARVLGLGTVSRDADFFELGGDSLKSISAVFEAESAGLNIAPFEMFDYPVLSDLAAHLERKAAEPVAQPGDDLMVHLRRDGAQPLFLMIHGSPQMCSHLGQALGADRPLCFQFSAFLRGKPDRARSIEAMARDMLGRLRALRPKGPYYLGGYSVGGVIAIELARLLRAEGEDVPVLFLLDPSWETGLPFNDGDSGSLDWRKRGRAALRRAVIRGRLTGSLLRRRFGLGEAERLRLNHVGNAYRAALQRYRPRAYDGPVFMMVSIEVAPMLEADHGLARCLTRRTVERLDFHHLDLQRNADALFAWAARLSQVMREAERE